MPFGVKQAWLVEYFSYSCRGKGYILVDLCRWMLRGISLYRLNNLIDTYFLSKPASCFELISLIGLWCVQLRKWVKTYTRYFLSFQPFDRHKPRTWRRLALHFLKTGYFSPRPGMLIRKWLRISYLRREFDQCRISVRMTHSVCLSFTTQEKRLKLTQCLW